ncbi:MAG: hypothetical protein R2831_06470 [Chitinophagaceae bacterium]
MRILMFALLVLSNLFSLAQCPNPIIPKSGKTIQDFVPKGWFIKDSIEGDFNQDKLQDAVLLIAHNQELDDSKVDYDCNRPLIILQGTNSGYILSAYTKDGVLCKHCGGVFGDPYESITLKNNVLNINHYGGSAWRWTNNYTFRFQNKRWELIGISQDSYYNAADCPDDGVGSAGRNLSEVNFSTSKMHIIKTKDTNCKPFKDTWLSFKRKSLINLMNFEIDKNYFPIKTN